MKSTFCVARSIGLSSKEVLVIRVPKKARNREIGKGKQGKRKRAQKSD